jgi:hypothetical protein
MLLKEFFKKESRVRNPMDPSKGVTTYQWVGTGTNVVQGLTSTEYVDAVGDGWIPVDDQDDIEAIQARHRIIPGNRAPAEWMTEGQAQNEVAGGFMDEGELVDQSVPVRDEPEDEAPASTPGEKAPAKKVAAKKAPAKKAAKPKVAAAPKGKGMPTPKKETAFSPGATGTKARRSRDLTTDGAVPKADSQGTQDLIG